MELHLKHLNMKLNLYLNMDLELNFLFSFQIGPSLQLRDLLLQKSRHNSYVSPSSRDTKPNTYHAPETQNCKTQNLILTKFLRLRDLMVSIFSVLVSNFCHKYWLSIIL